MQIRTCDPLTPQNVPPRVVSRALGGCRFPPPMPCGKRPYVGGGPPAGSEVRGAQQESCWGNPPTKGHPQKPPLSLARPPPKALRWAGCRGSPGSHCFPGLEIVMPQWKTHGCGAACLQPAVFPPQLLLSLAGCGEKWGLGPPQHPLSPPASQPRGRCTLGSIVPRA